MLATVTNTEIVVFGFTILFVFGLLVSSFWFNWRAVNRYTCPSPYTGTPLRWAYDLGHYHREKVWGYLSEIHQYDNRPFDLKKAAWCRDTGRLFPNAIGWLDTVQVDWSFLQKRYQGRFVSWGSLSPDQQRVIRDSHKGMEGYQTAFSSPNQLPRMIEPEYALAKPGPLYVDFETKVLLGWKIVPGTELEVMIVQKPIK